MNIPAEIITLAIEGGYETADLIARKAWLYEATKNQFALDPEFWKALGKALGWSGANTGTQCKLLAIHYTRDTVGELGIIVGESRDNTGWRVRPLKSKRITYLYPKEVVEIINPENDKFNPGAIWHQNAQYFFDLILTNGDTAAYWKELLATHNK